MTEKEGAKKHHAKDEEKQEAEAKVEAGDVVMVEYEAWVEDTRSSSTPRTRPSRRTTVSSTRRWSTGPSR